MGLWYWITSEFKALGWYCVCHGPEFWLVFPFICGIILIILIITLFGGERK